MVGICKKTGAPSCVFSIDLTSINVLSFIYLSEGFHFKVKCICAVFEFQKEKHRTARAGAHRGSTERGGGAPP